MGERFQGFSIIVKILVILVIPTMFFTYVGHDPMKQKANNVRNIAVVNEDNGAEYENDSLVLGQQVISVLDDDSSYSWSVVNRSTAESGLRQNQFDAVIYFPSTFTKSILTFKEDEPVKAGIEYKIQSNLNAENAEKVQKELEVAKNTINTNVSTLYWSYVSQSMEDIRKKFDNILEKEIAFQKTMYEFYTPSSKNLTGEIDGQKRMLEGILSTANSANESSSESLQQIDGTKSEIEAFLSDVNAFKEYQLKQAQLMADAGQENQKLLEESIKKYESIITSGIEVISSKEYEQIPEFEEQSKLMYENVSTIQNQLDENSKKLRDLTESINSSNVNEQFQRLMELQRNNIKTYKQRASQSALNVVQAPMLSLRQNIQGGSSENPGTATQQGDVKLPENTASSLDLQRLKSELAQLKNNAAAVQNTDPAVAEKINASIGALEESLRILEQQVQEQNGKQQQWKNAVVEAVSNSKPVVKENVTNAEEKTVEKIRAKEQEILASSALTADRKAVLAPYFDNGIGSRNIDDLLQYYYYVSVFAGELSHGSTKDDSVIEDIIVNNEDYNTIMNAFERVKAESQLFYQLQGTMDDSVKSMTQFENDFYTFADDISSFVSDFGTQFSNVHAEIMSELFSIEENSTSVSENLLDKTNTPMFEDSPVDDLNGEFILTVQDSSAGALKGISSMVGSIAEQQDTITSHTNDLQSKVNSVQERADELNDKWAQNVGTTKNIKNDVYGLLNNTLVDDQQNAFMYDYLANPVQISGDAFKEKSLPTPPVIMLIIILISGILIGYFLHHFSNAKIMLHVPLFLLLTITVGLIISMYGMKIYSMHDTEAVKWSVLTVALLLTSTALVRLAFFIGPFVGSLLTIVLVVYFTSPLLDLVLPNFSVDHPIANVYINIQQGNSDGFMVTISVLFIMAIIFSIIPYTNMMKTTSISSETANEA